ncbi:hypothetical protein ACFQ0P_12270 [Microbacterium insulae]|uniref:50S ribosomal protein L29 n=1 Tax=Microbacterium insulae TaxID=483014 RepID=A0ABW3AJQ1_9MICO
MSTTPSSENGALQKRLEEIRVQLVKLAATGMLSGGVGQAAVSLESKKLEEEADAIRRKLLGAETADPLRDRDVTQ